MPVGTNRTHVENLRNPIEVLSPSSNRIFVALRVEDSKDRVSFTPFDDLPLDLGQSPVVGTRVIESLSVRVASSTHVVSSSIAPSTDWLSPSNRVPSKPRLRA
jgi:hypothetical protein